MKPRDYCCCAIPVVNFGIYSTLAEQFALGILAGTLSIATPESNTTAPVLSYSLNTTPQSSALQLLRLPVGFLPQSVMLAP
jgi:hypothetical protein